MFAGSFSSDKVIIKLGERCVYKIGTEQYSRVKNPVLHKEEERERSAEIPHGKEGSGIFASMLPRQHCLMLQAIPYKEPTFGLGRAGHGTLSSCCIPA